MSSPSTDRSIRELAESYWHAEESRDLNAILSHFEDDATFSAPGWNLHGHAQIRLYYEESALHFPGLEVEIVGEITDGDRSSLEWSAHLISPDGDRHALTGVNCVVVRNGRFLDVRAYYDPGRLQIG